MDAFYIERIRSVSWALNREAVYKFLQTSLKELYVMCYRYFLMKYRSCPGGPSSVAKDV
jgi:hypothetical protein